MKTKIDVLINREKGGYNKRQKIKISCAEIVKKRKKIAQERYEK